MFDEPDVPEAIEFLLSLGGKKCGESVGRRRTKVPAYSPPKIRLSSVLPESIGSSLTAASGAEAIDLGVSCGVLLIAWTMGRAASRPGSLGMRGGGLRKGQS